MDITHDLELNASAETIFNAVSTQAGINGWWTKDCTVSEKVGGTSHLKFDKQGKIVEMGFKTVELIPNQKVVWECTDNANPAWLGTKIITEIISRGDKTIAKFSHAEFNEKWRGQEPFEMTREGWKHFVSSLKSYCEHGDGQPW